MLQVGHFDLTLLFGVNQEAEFNKNPLPEKCHLQNFCFFFKVRCITLSPQKGESNWLSKQFLFLLSLRLINKFHSGEQLVHLINRSAQSNFVPFVANSKKTRAHCIICVL